MNTIRPVLLLLALAGVTAACGSKAPTTTTPPHEPGVDVSIASVTLAEDCGTGPTTAPPEPSAAEDVPASGDSMEGASASMAKRACQQSSIQLRVANTGAEASKVVIQKVELIDSTGAVIGELITREPSQWAEDSYSYQTWDEQVAPSAVLQVSYALSDPAAMRGASYTVRVTVAAGDDERTLEKTTTLEAEGSMPPDAVT